MYPSYPVSFTDHFMRFLQNKEYPGSNILPENLTDEKNNDRFPVNCYSYYRLCTGRKG